MKAGTKVLIFFLSIFAVMFIVNGIFVYYALHTNHGVITEHAYEKGLNYNDILAEKKIKKALGWKLKISHNAENIIIILRDKNNNNVNAKIAAKAVHLVKNINAVSINFENNGKNYTTLNNLPINGRWQLDISVKTPDNILHYKRNITLL